MEGQQREPDLITPAELAQLLRCGRTKAYELLRSNAIPSYRVGRKRLTPRSAAIAWIHEQRDERGA